MTGTPLENNPGEFVNLLHICSPEIARTVQSQSNWSTMIEHVESDEFTRKLAPVYLRRNQEDVLHELPQCIEVEQWIELSEGEWKGYFGAVESRNLMTMRQATIGFNGQSSKLNRLAELLEYYRSTDEKVVVFSFFINTLNEIGELIGEHHRIDGSVPPKHRMGIINEFSESSGFSAMICQIDAGGVGINLHAASVVIIAEPQLKPTTEWQAIKRVHRMGQSRKVTVHRLLARDTIDERLRELLAVKSQTFDEYARESQIKDVSAAARDSSISKDDLIKGEVDRLAIRAE